MQKFFSLCCSVGETSAWRAHTHGYPTHSPHSFQEVPRRWTPQSCWMVTIAVAYEHTHHYRCTTLTHLKSSTSIATGHCGFSLICACVCVVVCAFATPLRTRPDFSTHFHLNQIDFWFIGQLQHCTIRTNTASQLGTKFTSIILLRIQHHSTSYWNNFIPIFAFCQMSTPQSKPTRLALN